jgi:hypothetical protein
MRVRHLSAVERGNVGTSAAETAKVDSAKQVAQAENQPVFFRTASLLMAFVPDAFTLFPFDEYQEYGIRGVVAAMEAWSGIKIKQSNTAPNFMILRDQGFDAIIDSEDGLTKSVLMSVFGSGPYGENMRRRIGAERDCHIHHVVDSHYRITTTIVLVNSVLPDAEEAHCVVKGMASAFGIVDMKFLHSAVSLSDNSGRISLGPDLKQAFTEIYVF